MAIQNWPTVNQSASILLFQSTDPMECLWSIQNKVNRIWFWAQFFSLVNYFGDQNTALEPIPKKNNRAYCDCNIIYDRNTNCNRTSNWINIDNKVSAAYEILAINKRGTKYKKIVHLFLVFASFIFAMAVADFMAAVDVVCNASLLTSLCLCRDYDRI